MELKDFVKTTLVEIAEGVKEAQDATTEMGAAINPSAMYDNLAKGTMLHDGVPIQEIEFDVAVVAREEADVTPGGGISIVVLKAEVNGKFAYENTAVNRIRFHVPIALPRHE